MALTPMYKGQVSSPQVGISVAINSTRTTIPLQQDGVFNNLEYPTLMVLGGDTDHPETIKALSYSTQTLTVERGFEGTAQSWGIGTKIGRNFTAYDYNTLVNNTTTINSDLVAHKADIVSQEGRHGLRYWQYKLEVKKENEWVEMVDNTPDPNSWAGIQKIVRQGLTNDFFTVGDQIQANYDGVPTTFEVIGIDVETPTDPQYTHSMTLQTKDILHDMMFDNKEPNNPDSSRQSYGNNRYTHSAIRQWLNSNEATFNWQSQHSYDAKPTGTLYSGAGFLNRLDPEFASVLGAVDKKVALNTVTDGGGQETFSDKVFLLSPKEVGYTPSEMSNDGIYTGESVYPFYDGASNADRIKQLNSSNAIWWLRSPGVSGSRNVRLVLSSGTLHTSDRAYSEGGVSPACVII